MTEDGNASCPYTDHPKFKFNSNKEVRGVGKRVVKVVELKLLPFKVVTASETSLKYDVVMSGWCPNVTSVIVLTNDVTEHYVSPKMS